MTMIKFTFFKNKGDKMLAIAVLLQTPMYLESFGILEVSEKLTELLIGLSWGCVLLAINSWISPKI